MTFRLFFPGQKDPESKEPPSSLRRESTDGGSETVLVVEDEEGLLKMTCRMLTLLGYTCLGAENPLRALQITREYEEVIDVLLTDVVMPQMNGRELARRLMAHYPNLKCLFMSGYDAAVIVHKGVLEEGTNFYRNLSHIISWPSSCGSCCPESEYRAGDKGPHNNHVRSGEFP